MTDPTVEPTDMTCALCGYEPNDAQDSKAHYAKEHSFKADRMAGGYRFLWFETSENYCAYHQDSDGIYGDELGYNGDYFVDSGWYGLRSQHVLCRCGGKCHYAIYGRAASFLRDDLVTNKLPEKAAEITRLMESKP